MGSLLRERYENDGIDNSSLSSGNRGGALSAKISNNRASNFDLSKKANKVVCSIIVKYNYVSQRACRKILYVVTI